MPPSHSASRFAPHQWNYDDVACPTCSASPGTACHPIIGSGSRTEAHLARQNVRLRERLGEAVNLLDEILSARQLNATKSHRENETEHQKAWYAVAAEFLDRMIGAPSDG